MTIDFICEELAELFDSPCDYSPMDEKMFQDSYCESHCGKVTDKECWKQYFEKVWADRKTEPQTDGYMTAEQAEDYRKMLDKAEHKVYGNIEDEPQTERLCTNCKHNGVVSVPKCDECNNMDKHEFIEPQTEKPKIWNIDKPFRAVLFADKEKTMARQTTKRKVETPEGNAAVLEEIKHESGIDALRAEIDRLNWVIRQKDLTINALQKGNEKLSDELSKARNDG